MIIFLWVVLSLLGAFIAGRKQRSFWNFFLLGMALSPVVGVAAAAMAKPDEARLEMDHLATGRMRICGQCRTLVPWNVARCSECNVSLEAVSPPARWDGTERRRQRRDMAGADRRNPLINDPSLIRRAEVE